jgi:uncharacterized protein
LEERLAGGERATGAQMVIAIFPSLAGESLEDVSIRLAERWRIGRQGLDNGVILLAFVRDRQLRLEVGYGLEPVIPDAEAGRIIGEVISPRFREGRYADGLQAAADAIYGRIARPAAPPPRRDGAGEGQLATAAVLVMLAVIAVMMIGAFATSRRLNRRRGYTLGPGGRYIPPTSMGWGSWGRGGGGGGFSGGGGSFGGGGASGRW